jgi:hypothetical protein
VSRVTVTTPAGTSTRRRDFTVIKCRRSRLSQHTIDDLSGNHCGIDGAESEFQWATELRPGRPYPWFGLGLALARA